MRGLTTLDYINIAALVISTLLIGAVQWLHWDSPVMMMSMLLLVAIVLINSLAVRKYRRQFRQGRVPVLTSIDRMMSRVMMVVMALIVIAVLWSELR